MITSYSPASVWSIRCGFLWLMVLSVTWSGLPGSCFVVADETELSEEEIRQIKTAERFLSILERNPRQGTALDRVYGHHVEFGSLDSFLESLQQRVEDEPDNGAVWMLLGMLESHRGSDAAAVEALLKADELRPDDAMASYF